MFKTLKSFVFSKKVMEKQSSEIFMANENFNSTLNKNLKKRILNPIRSNKLNFMTLGLDDSPSQIFARKRVG